MSRAKDWTGQTFNSLTFIRPIGKKSPTNQSIMWEVQCVCGKIIHRNSNDVTKGRTKNCGCLRYPPDEMVTARRVFCTYVTRDPYCDLTFEDFYRLSQQRCHYCQCLPFSTRSHRKHKPDGSFTYNGLDRIDSGKYHTLDNVVPCCHPCNWSKMDRTTEEFIAHIYRTH